MNNKKTVGPTGISTDASNGTMGIDPITFQKGASGQYMPVQQRTNINFSKGSYTVDSISMIARSTFAVSLLHFRENTMNFLFLD